MVGVRKDRVSMLGRQMVFIERYGSSAFDARIAKLSIFCNNRGCMDRAAGKVRLFWWFWQWGSRWILWMVGWMDGWMEGGRNKY